MGVLFSVRITPLGDKSIRLISRGVNSPQFPATRYFDGSEKSGFLTFVRNDFRYLAAGFGIVHSFV